MLEDLAAEFKAPERFCGVHYFQPADVFPMVEVIAGPQTPRAVIERVADAIRRTRKEPIVQMRAVPGFLINRLQHAILHEAYHLIESGVCTPAEVDSVAKWMLGPRMCVTGLIEHGARVPPTTLRSSLAIRLPATRVKGAHVSS